jgi:hypothetical protein
MLKPNEGEYRYRVVTSRGAGIESKDFTNEAEAQAHANALRDQDHRRYEDAEVERTQKVGRGHRNWLKREGEWRHTHYVRAGWTREQIAAREAEEAAEPRPVGPRTWIGTFTREHFHPDTGQCLRFARVEFQAATQDDANDLMWEAFGDEGWWHAHDLEEVIRLSGSPWNSPGFRVAWPLPASPPGETVTLRVTITRAQAAEPLVWLAGRCLLHRPATDHEVQPGAGVSVDRADRPAEWGPRRSQDGAAGVGGEGTVLNVRYVRRDDAERAVATDPAHASIVEGSESFGTFRRPPKVFEGEPSPLKNKIVVTGVFSLDALYEIASADRSFRPVYDAALGASERTGAGDHAYAIELEANRILAVRVLPLDGR